MHFRTSALLLTLLAFFMFSSSCDEEQDTVQDVSNPSFSTSPQQLGDWFEQLTAIVKLNGTSAPEASRIFAYASIAFYEGFTMSDPTMRTLEGQIDGLENIPRPSVGEIYNYGIIAESAMTEVLYHGFDGSGSLIQNVIRSTYQNHENRYADIGVESPIIERSREHGKLLADIIIAWMDTDGYNQVMACEDTLASGSDFGSLHHPLCWMPNCHVGVNCVRSPLARATSTPCASLLFLRQSHPMSHQTI
jgi:hypothetical protein